MTELYLVRHGETELNIKGVYYGWTDCGLTELGIKQSEELADILAEIPFDIVIASSLKRAVDTAKIAAKSSHCELITDDRLRELNFGDWEGLHFKEIQETQREHWEKWGREWKTTGPPAGERFYDLYERVRESLEEILEKYRDKKILIVSHQGVLRVIATLLLGIDEEKNWCFFFEQGRYSLLEVIDGHCTIRKINCGR